MSEFKQNVSKTKIKQTVEMSLKGSISLVDLTRVEDRIRQAISKAMASVARPSQYSGEYSLGGGS